MLPSTEWLDSLSGRPLDNPTELSFTPMSRQKVQRCDAESGGRSIEGREGAAVVQLKRQLSGMPIHQQIEALTPARPLSFSAPVQARGAASGGRAIQFAPPTAKEVADLVAELDRQIAATDWAVYRLTILNKFDKPLIEEVKKRQTNTDEMTGIGAKLVVGTFVTSFKAIQARLSKGGKAGLPKLQTIADDYLAVANAALKSVGVPGLKQAVLTKSTVYGSFTPKDWWMNLNPDYLEPKFDASGQIEKDYSIGLAKTVFHEARHCEQEFRSARWLVGAKNKTAADLEQIHGLPSDVAKAAEAKPLDKKSGTAAEIAEAKTWVASFAIGRANTDPALKAVQKLEILRQDCITARDDLRKTASRDNYKKARKACRVLVKHKNKIPPLYEKYLALAHEKSAREAGYEVEVIY